MLLQRRRTAAAARHVGQRSNPLYGYDYNPAWPSILSVAHDVADGSRLFVITDRPCVLVGPSLPLEVEGLSIASAATVLPVKFHLTMSGAATAGAVWRWTGGGSDLYDPVTSATPNAAQGTCADVPGPYTPPTPVNVIATSYGTAGGGNAYARLTFDGPVVLNGFPPVTPDDAVTFDGAPGFDVQSADATTLQFLLDTAVGPGSTWAIVRQPAWVATPVVWPASGTF
jgi:hypothetical protein